jgi:hypothetical protein
VNIEVAFGHSLFCHGHMGHTSEDGWKWCRRVSDSSIDVSSAQSLAIHERSVSKDCNEAVRNEGRGKGGRRMSVPSHKAGWKTHAW